MLIALTRPVSATLNRCELTHIVRAPIDVERAIDQHRAYEECLSRLGCQVRRLPEMRDSPDAVFVEDTCVVLDELAVIARPGAESRRPEINSVAPALQSHRRIVRIESPGTLDGGDVLRIGRRVYVGRSSRTNAAGIEQLRQLLTPFDYEVIAVEVAGALHLKSAVTVVADNTILINPSWVDPNALRNVNKIEVDPAEPPAANALVVGSTVVCATAFASTNSRLRDHGLTVVTVDLSELAKAEGAVTCCSVVFETQSGDG
jgi:dimethylargininase